MIYKNTWFYVHYLIKVSFLELGNGIKIPQDRSFGYYNLFQDCFLGKIQGKTTTGSNAKYMEHSYPLLRRQEEKQDLVLVQYCYSW